MDVINNYHIDWANIVMTILALSLCLSLYRLIIGPSLADRIASLDLISMIITSMMCTYSILSNDTIYIDVAIAVVLVTFLSTVAFSRYKEKSLS